MGRPARKQAGRKSGAMLIDLPAGSVYLFLLSNRLTDRGRRLGHVSQPRTATAVTVTGQK